MPCLGHVWGDVLGWERTYNHMDVQPRDPATQRKCPFRKSCLVAQLVHAKKLRLPPPARSVAAKHSKIRIGHLHPAHPWGAQPRPGATKGQRTEKLIRGVASQVYVVVGQTCHGKTQRLSRGSREKRKARWHGALFRGARSFSHDARAFSTCQPKEAGRGAWEPKKRPNGPLLAFFEGRKDQSIENVVFADFFERGACWGQAGNPKSTVLHTVRGAKHNFSANFAPPTTHA